MIDGGGHDAEGDVRGVKGVMAQGRRRIVGCRGAVHEGHWPERRFADRPAGHREARRRGDGHAPDGRQLHEQVVGMLSIN